MGEEGGVAAVERALSILDALTEDRVTLVELSKRTGLYKSTVLRLLKSLEKYGYVLRNAEGLYRLGSKVLLLGSLYQRHFRTSDIVPPVLEKLAADLHEGASFYVCEDDKRICLHRVDSTRAIRDSVHVGDRLPLTVGAAGHVLRAFTGARGERFDEIRRAMYAASFGERDAETAAIAAPVFGSGNRLMGALSVSGPRYRLEELGEARIVPVLFKYAKELTRTCGGNVDDPTLSGWNLPEPKRKAASRAAKPAPAKTPARRAARSVDQAG
ncbi:IclR family transcriptional regulator [Rhizobacter sp. Root404]|jgi:DNA-binding IclR family transcriptional regulator|uniref:IclR family transcriptional regulator n=1 Tax=Rhizobacter sp. Root404 TaxID=1736528 RepID=UPI0009EB504A|nr:IclR family transcriptional regulator [Rhizobacter sp. Root404]